MNEARVYPRIKIYENGNAFNMIEPLYWRNGKKHYLGLVKNPTDQKERSKLGQLTEIQGISGQAVEIKLEFRDPVRKFINLRTGKKFGAGQVFQDNFKPWEGNLYELVY